MQPAKTKISVAKNGRSYIRKTGVWVGGTRGCVRVVCNLRFVDKAHAELLYRPGLVEGVLRPAVLVGDLSHLFAHPSKEGGGLVLFKADVAVEPERR